MGFFNKLFTNATPPPVTGSAAVPRGYKPLSSLTTGGGSAPVTVTGSVTNQMSNQLHLQLGNAVHAHPSQNYYNAIAAGQAYLQAQQNGMSGAVYGPYGVQTMSGMQNITSQQIYRSYTSSQSGQFVHADTASDALMPLLARYVEASSTGEAIMLEPINIPGTTLTRVPLQVLDRLDSLDHYAVYVGAGLKRLYTREGLPDIFKSKMAIISTSKEAAIVQDSAIESSFRIQVQLYLSKFPPEFAEIGWRVSEHFYCIVIPREELVPLQSGTLVKDPVPTLDPDTRFAAELMIGAAKAVGLPDAT